MAVVGSAEIIVRAITSKVKGDIQAAFRDARPAVKAEGQAAAQDYLKSFRDSFSKGIGDAVKDGMNSPALSNIAAESGKNTGSIFNSAMSDELGNLDVGGPLESATNDASSRVESAARSGAQRASSSFEREMGAGGRRGGNSFAAGFLSSGFADAAVGASKAFTILIASGNLLGPAIAGLVGALSSAASGLFAMASAASVAAGSLAVLPGAVSVAAQAMGALKLAFSGVGKAVTAGFAPAKAAIGNTAAAVNAARTAVTAATTGLARAQADAATRMGAARQTLARAEQDAGRSMAAARKGLADAYQSAAEAMVQANQKVKDAGDSLKDAQKDEAQAQRDLTQARKDALEDLQQLAFGAEDAALGEERAGISLEKARDKLIAAQSLPVNNRDRREAELGFKEAELAYREAKDRNSDTQKEAKKAAKAGVNGTKGVIDAKKKVNDAQKKTDDAEKNLFEARQARAKTERDNAQSIADAKANIAQTGLANSRAIADAEAGIASTRLQNSRAIEDAQNALKAAQDRLAEAQRKGAAAANAYGTALAGLSKPAAAFVRYLVSLKDEFGKLKAAAGQELFPKLTVALKDIVANVFPVLEGALRRTGGLLGEMAVDFAHTISSGEGLKNLKTIFKGNNDILAVFTKENKKGKSAIDSLAIVITRLLVAVQPITKRFAEWIAKLIRLADVATNTPAKMKKLTDFFEKAGDRAALLGDIVGNLIGIVFNLGKAADPAGVGLLNSFKKATQALQTFTGSKKGQKELGKFFTGVATNMRAIGRLITAIGKEFLSLGDNKGIGQLADGLIPAVKNFGDIGDELTKAGPSLAKFAVAGSQLIKNLTSGNAIGKFISNLTLVINKLNDITGSNTGRKILGIAGSIAAVTRVAALVLIPLKFLFKALVGGPIAVMRGFGKMFGTFRRLQTALGFLRKGKVGDAFRALTKGSDAAKLALEKQMVTDKKKVGSLAAVELAADKTALALERVKVAGAPGVGAAAAPVTAPAAAGAKAASGASSLAAAPSLVGASKGASGAAAGAAKATGRFSKMGGVMGKLAKGPFKLIGKSFMLMGRGLLAVLGPIGLVIAAGVLLALFFKQLFKHSPAFRKFVGIIVAKLKELGDWFKNIMNTVIWPAIDRFLVKVGEVAPKVGKFLGDLFKSVGGFIAKYFTPVWNNVLIPAFGILMKVAKVVFKALSIYFRVLFTVIKFYITNIFVPYWKLIWEGIQLLWKIARPIFRFIIKAFVAVAHGIKAAWEGVLQPVLSKVGGAFVGIVRAVIRFVIAVRKKFNEFKAKVAEVFTSAKRRIDVFKHNMGLLRDKIAQAITNIKKKFDEFKNKVREVIERFITSRINNFKRNMQTLRDKVREVIEKIKVKFNEFRDKVRDVVAKVISKLVLIKEAFNRFREKIREVINNVKSKIGELVGKLQDVKEKLRKKVNDIKDMFGEIATKVSNVFGRLGGFARNGINNFIDFLNTKLIDKINKVTSKFGLSIGHIGHAAEGGPIKGRGGPTEDNLPYMLSSGEYVVKAASAKRIGEENLNYMNRYGRPPSGLQMGLGDIVGGAAHAVGGAAGSVASRLHVPDTLEGLYNKGVGKTLKGLITASESLMDNFGIKRGRKGAFTLDNFFYGIMDKMADKADQWGQRKDEAHQRALARAAAAAAAAGGLGGSGGSVAHQVIATGKALGASNRDIIISLITGITESGLRNLHGGDRDSVGVFQQRNAWGSFAERTNVPKSTRLFYRGGHAGQRGLFDIHNRGSMSMGQAAQTVQVSAFPDRYQTHVPQARSLLRNYNPNEGGGGGGNVNVGSVAGGGNIINWKGGTFTRLFVAHMKAAERLGGFGVHVTQGGFRPYTSYSAATHAKDAIDSQVSSVLIRSFRRVGIASGDRTGLGNWAGHVHSVPGPGAGHASPSAHRQWLDYLRRGGRRQGLRSPWGLAQGGIAIARPGGILANIAEGGRNERVEPLGRDGLSKRDEAMIDLIKKSLANGQGGGTTINVYPSRGMDEIELANLVSRRIAWKRRPGA